MVYNQFMCRKGCLPVGHTSNFRAIWSSLPHHKVASRKLVPLSKHSPEKRRTNLYNQKYSSGTHGKLIILLNTKSGVQKFWCLHTKRPKTLLCLSRLFTSLHQMHTMYPITDVTGYNHAVIWTYAPLCMCLNVRAITQSMAHNVHIPV